MATPGGVPLFTTIGFSVWSPVPGASQGISNACPLGVGGAVPAVALPATVQAPGSPPLPVLLAATAGASLGLQNGDVIAIYANNCGAPRSLTIVGGTTIVIWQNDGDSTAVVPQWRVVVNTPGVPLGAPIGLG